MLDERNVLLHVRADLPKFPRNAQKKWIEQQANTVQIKLDFWLCESIIIKGFTSENIADLKIKKDDVGELIFSLNGMNEFMISGSCKSIYLQKISAYQDENNNGLQI